jgi:hypothetical protein
MQLPMHRATAAAAAAAFSLALAAPGPPPEPPRHPVPATPVRALPSLDSSDAAVREAIMKIPGASAFAPMLATDGIVRRFVMRVDDLASGSHDASPQALAALADVDAKSAAMLYSRMYPLLQQAYEEHSPGRGYFNDRLVEAIDRLLAQRRDFAAPAHAKLAEMRRLLAMKGPR